jgi:hypothetical protein
MGLGDKEQQQQRYLPTANAAAPCCLCWCPFSAAIVVTTMPTPLLGLQGLSHFFQAESPVLSPSQSAAARDCSLNAKRWPSHEVRLTNTDDSIEALVSISHVLTEYVMCVRRSKSWCHV